MVEIAQVSIVIPTSGRDKVLLDTIRHLFEQTPKAKEILIVDQTQQHDLTTEKKLAAWHESNEISWVRLSEPSITHAMNKGLLEALSQIVLFLDDDIVPAPGLLETHASSYSDFDTWAVIGQILQPGQEAENVEYYGCVSGIRAFYDFPFYSTYSAKVQNVMAGNLSVLRDKAIEIGGFDENFIGAAYRFETEFARRIVRSGGQILFQPKASIRHLRAESGGTRTKGIHLNSISPLHGVGDYYFAFRQGLSLETFFYILRRPFREIRTKFHFKRPWWIPVKFIGEIRALFLAISLAIRGPKLFECKK